MFRKHSMEILKYWFFFQRGEIKKQRTFHVNLDNNQLGQRVLTTWKCQKTSHCPPLVCPTFSHKPSSPVWNGRLTNHLMWPIDLFSFSFSWLRHKTKEIPFSLTFSSLWHYQNNYVKRVRFYCLHEQSNMLMYYFNYLVIVVCWLLHVA